jgi:serine/threonine protein kinase
VRVIADRYELGPALGRGGMSLVWEGIDRRLNRPVAIKLIAGDHPDGREKARRRFYREARITGRLRHPAIPVLYDFGDDDGEFYIVMELVEGCTIGQLVGEVDALPASWAAIIGAQVCSALAAAHAENLIHRDLKPANVLICRDGAVKVLDFGIAAALQGADYSGITVTGEIPGSACYLAPELTDGQDASKASEMYAVGCLLHELLTGERVFASADPLTEIARHRSEQPVPVTRIRADVPAGFEQVVIELLAKEPVRRPANAISVGDRLMAFVDELPCCRA